MLADKRFCGWQTVRFFIVNIPIASKTVGEETYRAHLSQLITQLLILSTKKNPIIMNGQTGSGYLKKIVKHRRESIYSNGLHQIQILASIHITSLFFVPATGL